MNNLKVLVNTIWTFNITLKVLYIVIIITVIIIITFNICSENHCTC